LRKSRRIKQHLLVPFEMIRHPQHAKAWFHDRFDKEGAIRQGVPWIAWPCIDYLTSYLKPEHKVFEWGGGGSTIFFLAKGCSVTTIESNEYWRNQIDARIGQEYRHRWQLRFVEADSNEDPRAPLYIQSVLEGGPWDVVLVDGWNREECLMQARETVRPGGLLLLDNANRLQYAHIPAVMRNGWERLPFRGLGPARTWVTQTDVYVKR
jgi:hypothetical protein